MTATRVKVLVVTALAAAGVYACFVHVLPLGARAVPALLLVGWLYLVTLPIAGAWRRLGPAPREVVDSVAFKLFALPWAVTALAVALRSIVTGIAPVATTRENAGFVFCWITLPLWWGLLCSLVTLFLRAGGSTPDH